MENDELDPKFDAATADRDDVGRIDPMARDGYLLRLLAANKALRELKIEVKQDR